MDIELLTMNQIHTRKRPLVPLQLRVDKPARERLAFRQIRLAQREHKAASTLLVRKHQWELMCLAELGVEREDVLHVLFICFARDVE